MSIVVKNFLDKDGNPVAVNFYDDGTGHLAPVYYVVNANGDPPTATLQGAGNTTLTALNAKIPSAPATAGNQTTGNTNLASIDSKVPALGQAVAAGSWPVVMTAVQYATLTSIDTKTPALVSGAVPISGTFALPTSSTGTHANVAASVTVVTIQAANASRQGLTIFNDSTAVLTMKCGAAASSTSFTVQIAAGGYYELPFRFTGIITGLWSAATGSARVVEFT